MGGPLGGNYGPRLEAVLAKEINVVVVSQDQVGVDALFPHSCLGALKATRIEHRNHLPIIPIYSD